MALEVGEIAHLEEWAQLVAAPKGTTPKKTKTSDPARTKSLLKILMEVYTQEGRKTVPTEVADLLNSQGVNLEVNDVSPRFDLEFALCVILTTMVT